ncbi:MAG: sugar ABC transporter permease, partial [Kiloniellales bacterium]|nr:sugar ABC transporter permease [Kiloniellales bacterium]
MRARPAPFSAEELAPPGGRAGTKGRKNSIKGFHLKTVSLRARIMNNRNVMGLLFMLPAATILLVFLTYPLGLGVWLGLTDVKVGRPGIFVGLENFIWLFDDDVFWLSVFNTFLYTVVASIIKFALGLWLSLILIKHSAFKDFLRAIVLVPFIVPTVLSALAFWLIYDSQVS